MASSLPGVNARRSCRLQTDAARLDKPDMDDEGLMPVRAFTAVKRLSAP